MGAVIALELLLEQVRTVVALALWDFKLTPAAWQLLCWLQMERNEGAARLAELTCRHRQETQRLLERLEKRELVTRLPDLTRDRTGSWMLTPEGTELVAEITKRLAFFDGLLEREFRDQLPAVIDAVQRIRTVFSTRTLSSTAELYETRLRVAGKLVPPKKWSPDNWDL
ncbi:MAG: hypothetical protein ACO1OB_08205 [Archangium sp.]